MSHKILKTQIEMFIRFSILLLYIKNDHEKNVETIHEYVFLKILFNSLGNYNVRKTLKKSHFHKYFRQYHTQTLNL